MSHRTTTSSLLLSLVPPSLQTALSRRDLSLSLALPSLWEPETLPLLPFSLEELIQLSLKEVVRKTESQFPDSIHHSSIHHGHNRTIDAYLTYTQTHNYCT